MSLILESLPCSLYTISRIKAVNNNIIKTFILNINTAGQSCIYYHEVIFRRHHTCSYNDIINSYLFRVHRLIRIIKRMQLNRAETLINSCGYDSLIGFNIRRIAPVSPTRFRPQFLHMIQHISKIYIFGHTVARF